MTRVDLSALTPGQRAAQRGRFSVRPGQPDYLEMQLLSIAQELQRHPMVRSLAGDDPRVVAEISDLGQGITFHVSRACSDR